MFFSSAIAAAQLQAVPATAVPAAGIGAGVALTRNLANLPGNVCTPTHLANTARELARRHRSIRVRVLAEAEIRRLKAAAAKTG